MNPTIGYAKVNGLLLYYEILGDGFPLVLLHGGGSTILTTWGRILPELAKRFTTIAVELQSHGHTADIDRPLSFEQDADDVAALLIQQGISRANFMGFSNGGTATLQIAARHPHLVNKIIPVSALFKKSGMPPGFWEVMKAARLDDMPRPLKDAFLDINNDHTALAVMFNRDRDRMLAFRDIPDDIIGKISAPALVINGDRDVVTVEHAVELSKILQNGRLAILPGIHGECIGEICSYQNQSNMLMLVVEMITEFTGMTG